MLILIFTSKLPRERGELLFRKKKNTPYHMSIPINVKHLPCASMRRAARRGGADRCGGISLHPEPWERLCTAMSRGPAGAFHRARPETAALSRKELHCSRGRFRPIPQREQSRILYLHTEISEDAGISQRFVALLAFCTYFSSIKLTLFIVFLPA